MAFQKTLKPQVVLSSYSNQLLTGVATMQQLSSSTVRLITSTQVITSVTSAVKELIENSLDAQASSIEVRLENYGLDKIEVRDNGCGVPREDVDLMGQPHFTSKLSSTEDLETLSTYGFRGEALGSLCAVSDVTVTTKTASDDVSYVYTLDHRGHVTGSKPSHLGQGTGICAMNLFKNLPVRKQFYSTSKKKKESLKGLEELVISFAVICPAVRFLLRHGKETIWQSSPVASSRHVLQKVLGGKVTGQLVHIERTWEDPQFELEAYLPGVASDVSDTSKTSTERLFVYVNSRPVVLKSVEKLLKDHYSRCHGLETPKFPVGFLHIQTSSKLLDVNLEPNKTKVMFHRQAELLQSLEEELKKFYHKESVVQVSKETNRKDTSDPNASPDVEAMSRVGSNINHHETNDSTLDIARDKDCSHSNSYQDTHVSTEVNETNRTMSVQYSNKGSLITDSECISASTKSDQRSIQNASDVFQGVEVEAFSSFDDCELNSGRTRQNIDSESRVKTIELCQNNNKLSDKDKNNIEKQVEKDNLFSLDDSLDDLLLTNENPPSIINKISDPETVLTKSVGEKDSDYSTLFGKDVDPEFPRRSYQGQSSDGLSQDSHLITSTRVDCTTNNGTNITNNTNSIDEKNSTGNDENNIKFQSAFDLFADESDELMMLDIDTPVKNQVESGSGESLSSWSKGTAVAGTGGASVQPVKVLQPGGGGGGKETGVSLMMSMSQTQQIGDGFKTSVERQQSPAITSTPKQKGLSPCQPTLFDCSGVGAIKKPTSAYISFSKEIRPKVVEENPGASFQDIGRITGEKWAALPESERQKYKEESYKELKRFKEHQSKMSLTSPVNARSIKRKKIQKKSPSSNSLDESKCRAVVKQETVMFSMNTLKNRCKLSNSQSSQSSPNDSQTTHFLKDLEIGDVRCWIALRGNQIVAFQPIRAKELLIYHKLMHNHALPVDSLAEPIILRQSDFTNLHHWQTLQSLQKSEALSPDPYCYYTDVRLVKNGFRIRQLPDQNCNDTQLEITAMTRAMNYFGKGDLLEILHNISDCLKKGGHCSLNQCRPTKVDHFLQAEAVRMARQLPVGFSEQDVKETLQQIMDSFSPNVQHCFHNKPFLLTLYDLCDIPLTQTQS